MKFPRLLPGLEILKEIQIIRRACDPKARQTDRYSKFYRILPYTVARNLKEIPNYPPKEKVTNTRSKHGLSGRCPGAVNVNIGPVIGSRIESTTEGESDTL